MAGNVNLAPPCAVCGSHAAGWYITESGPVAYCGTHGPFGDLICVKRSDWERAQADAARLEAAEAVCRAFSEFRINLGPSEMSDQLFDVLQDRYAEWRILARRAARAPETTEGKCWCHLAMIVPRVHHCDTPLNGTPYPK